MCAGVIDWAPRGLLLVGGECDVDTWLCRRPLLDGELSWQKLPDLPLASSAVNSGATHNPTSIPIDAHKLLLCLSACHGPSPSLCILEHSPWRWSQCACMGAVPRGVRRGASLLRAAADVLVLWGGHAGGRMNQFDDPDGDFYMLHEARVLRMLPSAHDTSTPMLRFGQCTVGQPPPTERRAAPSNWDAGAQRQPVMLHGLITRSELNGRLGVVDGGETRCGSASRVPVRLISVETGDEAGSAVLVKPSNLEAGVWRAAPSLHWCAAEQLAIGLFPSEGERVLGVAAMRLAD